jgi:hypothetical protein
MDPAAGEELPFRSKPTRTAKGRKKLKQEKAAQLAESGAASAPLFSALLPQTPKKQNLPGPVHKSSWKKRASRSDFILFRFPPEIKQEVLSYLSLQRVSSYRRVCQEFYDIVAECEKALAGPQIEENLYRLQRGIRAISSCGMPTDARSFLRCLKVWTLFRGSFLDTECSQNSLFKWFCHLAGEYPDFETERSKWDVLEKWSLLAMQATRLQIEINRRRDRNDHDAIGFDLFDFLLKGVQGIGTLPISSEELKRMYIRMVNARGHWRLIVGPFHYGKRERRAFPSNHHGRYRLTPLRLIANDHPKAIKRPVSPAEIMCGNLGLPELPGKPDSHTFCYFVKSETMFKLLTGKVVEGKVVKRDLSPLMRAEILKWVDIF